ncbi:hypothetical protein Zmor_014852 [Zophobas morio]|uniref:Retrotransposon gag domain-containing protein n=1 Tax=Zophobas morio TaxID=2755281 RepID=A0AA38MHE0_9CUCU|nr:hypothetical protein Zmor_014852 [Zophobas morio]
MEDRMKSMEDRMESKMKKFAKIIKNSVTSGAYNVVSTPRTIQLPIYDSTTPWSSYKKQFEAATAVNLWEEAQKATAVVIALRGAALDILQTLSEEERNRYSALTTALELRFGDDYLKQVFADQLKTRTQKVGESPQEFAADVKKMVRLANSETPPTVQERLATETFVNGIPDVEVKKVLHPSRYQTSSDALIRALEVEAGYISSRTCYKVSIAETEKEENNKIEKLLEKLLQQIDALFRRRENDVSPKQSVDCYRWGAKDIILH